MELISQRVAAGLPVKPTRRPRKNNRKKNTKPHTEESGSAEASGSSTSQEKREKAKDKSVDWKKWGDRAALGAAWADDGKRLINGQVCLHIIVSFRISGYIFLISHP